MNQTSPLENLAGPGKSLHKEPPDQSEINGLIGSGNARLRDAEIPTLALESRFDLAYNAAHAKFSLLQKSRNGRFSNVAG